MLTPEQVQHYRDRGYVKASGIMTDAEVDTLRRVTDDFIEKSRTVRASDKVFDVEDCHTPEDPRLRRLKRPEDQHPAYAAIFMHPGILAVLRQLLGPDVRHKGLKLNLKPGGGGEPVEWHQDWAFYPHTNDDMLAVGVMLDDAFLENGPLMVIPGSHKGPTWNHHSGGYFCGAMDPTRKEADFESAVPLTGKAGSMSFHHVRTVHGSAQNVSDRSRRLLLYEFSAGDAFPLMGIKDWAKYNCNLVSGAVTNIPRIVPAPVRMPLPPAPFQGSIYENQTTLENKYFARKEPAKV